MELNSELAGSGQGTAITNKLQLGIAVACILFMTPFAVNNFIQGRAALGAGALAIVGIFVFHTWSIIRYQRHYPALILFGLVPLILVFLNVSLHRQGMIGVFWCYPAAISFYIILPERKAWIANAALLASTIPLIWSQFEAALAARIVVTLALVSIFSIIFIRVITQLQETLRVLAVTDPLTRVLNRVLLEEFLEQAVAQSRRADVPMTLASLDLDHFKNINDTLGHDAGDRVLKGVADLLTTRCRSVDRVFRVGGEEFLLYLYGTDLHSAKRLADELRRSITASRILPDRPVTASIGVASLQPGETWREWLKRSDESLYQAKADGRDRVVG